MVRTISLLRQGFFMSTVEKLFKVPPFHPRWHMKAMLPSGQIYLYDKKDHELVSKYTWWYHSDGYCYVHVKHKDWTPEKKRKTAILMHVLIMNTPKGMDTDHKNQNGLDNRRCNLRITDRSQNNYNSGLHKNNTSGQRGVNWFKPAKLWRAYIGGGKNRVELGYFKNKEDAIKARLNAEKIYIKKD